MKKIVLFFLFSVLICVICPAQQSDPFEDYLNTIAEDTVPPKNGFFQKFYRYFESANMDKTLEKKIDFSIIGGPHYSSDVGFGIGLVASGLYRIDKENLDISPSNVSIFGDIATSGFFLLGVSGNNIMKGGKYRIDYNTVFYSNPSDFWGIGYHDAEFNEKSDYKRLQARIKADFLYRIFPSTYIGLGGSFNYVEGKNFSNINYLHGQGKRYISTGAGPFFVYDSRDFIPNAYKGIYVKLDYKYFPEFFGNKSNFSKTEFIGDVYQRLWKGAILAYDLHGEFNTGNVPWTMLALLGGTTRMRGYYQGHYRDRNIIDTQVELRQKVYNRHGVAAWVGAGNVFYSFDKFKWSHTLPTYGIGYRWEFKNRVNVRLDYGIGKGQKSFIFNINESF
ncbi:MAG: outer membrane protein assembly factor [Rikenellaceae bacterium]|nr:outer membrane protein assembly factor [Rikenellaceae bacterium]